MQVETIARQDFVHGTHQGIKDQIVSLPEGVAHDLGSAGLVEYARAKPTKAADQSRQAPGEKQATTPKNKAAAKSDKK